MAKNLTYQERLIAGLLLFGWEEDKLAVTRKYKVFKKVGKEGKYFVGKMGALRFGQSATGSRSVGDPSSQTETYLKYLNAKMTHTVWWTEGDKRVYRDFPDGKMAMDYAKAKGITDVESIESCSHHHSKGSITV